MLPTRRDHHVTFVAELDAGTFVCVAGGVLDRLTLLKSIDRSQLRPWAPSAPGRTAVGF